MLAIVSGIYSWFLFACDYLNNEQLNDQYLQMKAAKFKLHSTIENRFQLCSESSRIWMLKHLPYNNKRCLVRIKYESWMSQSWVIDKNLN